MSDNIVNYSSISETADYWINNIAPNYFDFDNTNNYRCGIFGYINEVMGNTTEDAFNAINIARKEFYPISATNKSSLYKMAAMQKIDIPLVTPATAKAILMIPQKEIIEKSKFNNGIYSCVIDNTLVAMADDIPFMLDYPIVILTKKIGEKWVHTTHYDTAVSNSLNNTQNKYIMNKIIKQNGSNYILLSVTLRQVEVESVTELINKETNIDTVTTDFSYDGNISNFEIFYNDSNAKKEIQLKKIIKGGRMPQEPFCYYEITDNNTIRIVFPKNAYFTPAFNSEITMKIYKSLGVDGNFDVLKNALICKTHSEKYQYNNTMTITGIIDGASSGGKNKPTDDEFRRTILDAYSTNNTITTASDLQIYFNKISYNSEYSDKYRILFRKKRDDALIRLFGAYILMKDKYDNVIPSNSIDMTLSFPIDTSQRVFIKPGTLFEYKENEGDSIAYSCQKLEGTSILDNLEEAEKTKFVFANPLLISITKNPNIIGYYLNSINDVKGLEFKYVNDNTNIQFISNNLKIVRNAVVGENFYKISIRLLPASDLTNDVVEVPDITAEENIIRAKANGIIYSCQYEDKSIIATIKYDNGEVEKIQCSTYSELQDDGTFKYTTGYKLKFEIGDRISANDIIATKLVTDLGKIRVGGDFRDILGNNNLYIPFYIEEYNEKEKSFIANGYIGTDDTISTDGKILITKGIFDNNGVEDTDISMPMNNLILNINTFYNNDEMNPSNSFSEYKFFKNYTLTNIYSQNSNDSDSMITLIQQIDFIRSVMKYNDTSENELSITIKEVPVIKGSWAKNASNYNFLINTLYENYRRLYETYFLLENNFGIDLKFFNTYGKSKFFRIGIKDTSTILDSVNCSFSFGIKLVALTSPDLFLINFRNYVKEYVEAINDIGNGSAQSIYIMNMISSIKEKFSEIEYMEYYGFNNYDHSIQKIESIGQDEVLENNKNSSYIPEFININSVQSADTTIPKINVYFLDD